MAYTLAQLRTLVLQRADMQNTTFIGNTSASDELSNYIRDSAAALHDRMIDLLGADYGVLSENITTVAGTATYNSATPQNYYRTLRVGLVDGDFEYPLERWDLADVVRDSAQRSWTAEVRPKYKLSIYDDVTLTFEPPPDGVYTVRHYYHQNPPALAVDADEAFGIYAEWIILDAAIKCRVKEESDVTALQAERAAFEARMERWARGFDLYKPSGIIDARASEDGWW